MKPIRTKPPTLQYDIKAHAVSTFLSNAFSFQNLIHCIAFLPWFEDMNLGLAQLAVKTHAFFHEQTACHNSALHTGKRTVFLIKLRLLRSVFYAKRRFISISCCKRLSGSERAGFPGPKK